MAFDATLATRIRAVLGDRPDMVEKHMFSGIYSWSAGTCVAASWDPPHGAAFPAEADRLADEPHVRPMDFTGRPMRGFLYVDPEGTATARALRTWVGRTVAFAESKPTKAAKG
jgi:hypothetical protein